MKIERTAIVGMGALGMLYGAHIRKALGRDAVTYILDEERYERYQNQEFICNQEIMDFRLERSRDAMPYDLVIVAVKYNGLSAALETMKNCVGEHTILMSVLNGISSEEIIAERYGSEKIIYTVAQGMDAMHFGHSLSYSKMGELRIGVPKGCAKENLHIVEAYFQKNGMPYQVEEDIMYRLWGKWMLNVGVNQTCMVYSTNYGGSLKPGEAHDTMIGAMREVLELSKAEGICLSEEEIDYYEGLLAALLPEGLPSMAQDRLNGKFSEVEMFAGEVLRRAAKYQMDVPVNQFLYKRVKEIESAY